MYARPYISANVGPFRIGTTIQAGRSPYGQHAAYVQPKPQQRPNTSPRTYRSTMQPVRHPMRMGAGQVIIRVVALLIMGFLGLVAMSLVAVALHIVPLTPTTPAPVHSTIVVHTAPAPHHSTRK